MGYNLHSYYLDNLVLVRMGFSLESIYDMIPYETNIYLGLFKKMNEKGNS